MKKYIVFIFLVMASLASSAQSRAKEFYVSSFKHLPLDLDARTLRPVIDQNGQKAALIKLVTTDGGFDFDVGIMGVTAVNKEVGEIWIYVPEKVQKITVRHPKYGVIRDWYFPVAIESGEVYEMLLNTPKQNIAESPQTIVIEQKFVTGSPQLPSEASGSVKRQGEKFAGRKDYKGLLLLADLGMMDVPSFGLRGGWCRKAGAYVDFRSSFNAEGTSYSCKSNGKLQNGSSIWTTGKENISAMNITAGAIMQLNGWLGVYAGAGYGSKVLAWEDVNNKWAEVEDFTFKGLALDAGAVFSFGNFALSAGINSIMFDYCQITFGFGVRL